MPSPVSAVSQHLAPDHYQSSYSHQHHYPSSADENSGTLLTSVKAQEDHFEELTRRLQAERDSLSSQLQQCTQVSDTASMTSITSTDDSFLYHHQSPAHHPPPSAAAANSYMDDGSPANSSKMSSHLLDSCLRELEERGTLNSGYIRDSGNMDYLQEDPYSSHRFAPHDPYYSGGSGGGGYDPNYANNTSFDGHSDHSIHSDRNRQMKNYSDLPNGGPYGSSGNMYQPNLQPQIRGSPQPPRSITPPDYLPPSIDGGGRDRALYERESPYHNLPPYEEQGGGHLPPYQDQGGGDFYDRDYYDDREDFGPGDPRYSDHLPPQSSHSYADEDMHAGYGLREDSYAGSRGSFQGPVDADPHHSSNYNDPYGDMPPRYNGGVHYPEDSYGQGPPGDYLDQHDARPMYSDQPSFHGEPDLQYEGDPRYIDERPESYRDIHNRSNGPQDDPYNNSFQAPIPQHPNSSFHDIRHDSYQAPPSPQQQPLYGDQDRFSDAPRERRSFDQPGSGNYLRDSYQEHPPSHPNDSFHDMDDSQRRFEGLPPVRADPFADDPFREQHSRDAELMRQTEDPYYRGASPSGGPDPVPYDDRGPPYDDQDVPEGYNRYQPGYPGDRQYPQNDPYYPEHEATRGLEQLNLGGPIPDARRTPSIDGRGQPMQMRYPDLQEVIDFLTSPDDSIKASAAAHLQHITYMDDAMKAKTRSMEGIPPLIRLLSHDLVEVHKNASGALQNLSYGKNNTENKRAIKNENGIPELIRLLRKTDQEDVKESVTGVLWNLSSCEDLKQSIIEDGLSVLVSSVILKYSGWSAMGNQSSQLPWTTVCRNTTGILRNVSSAGFDARKRLRECRGLVNALIYILKLAAENISSNDIDNKVVENTVCVLRNLSYRIQEVDDPDFFKKRSLPRQQTPAGKGKTAKTNESNSAGCFGNKSAKVKSAQNSRSGNQPSSAPPQLPPVSIEYRSLWGPEIHTLYSTVLKRCTNPITMEAAAGAIQNLTACDWQPAVESRAMVRKEKGLPLLVDLLSAESDRVVCATATALRNLAIDEKNKELVGKYAIRQLVSRLPRDHRNSMPDDTICAVVATLYEVVKDNQDFALALVQEDGLPRLMHINKSEGKYLARTLKFTQSLLKTLWGYKSLHSEYAKLEYQQSDFTTSRAYPRQDSTRSGDLSKTPLSSNHTTPYNTLSRPMSDQGYDDNTLTPARAQNRGYYSDDRHPPEVDFRGMNRSNASLHDSRPVESRERLNYSRDRIHPDEIAMHDISPGYAPLDEPRPHRTKPPVGGVPLFPNLSPAEPTPPPYGGESQPVSEPLYAQVNKGGRRRADPYADSGGQSGGMHHSLDGTGGGGGGGADSWV